ncbi:hypothetical protein NDU88_005054 [Pleurodeles waltl]|uniref:Uncharacterized protein n=1 Tax=Pleurodeles waltl TaxID=8319 RepID=A0AAV7TB50_PLEWA|nr:hypothetical protein NDU88_005054 [Pleurodeles waltl]
MRPGDDLMRDTDPGRGRRLMAPRCSSSASATTQAAEAFAAPDERPVVTGAAVKMNRTEESTHFPGEGGKRGRGEGILDD